VAALGALAATLSGCGGSADGGAGSGGSLVIALNVPRSSDRPVADTITRGADLAVKAINAAGGIEVGDATYTLSLKTYDDGGDPQRAAANDQTAIDAGAVAIIEDGVGAAISGPRGQAAGVPEIATANGLSSLTGGAHPSVFRLGIGNDAAASVLATYVGSHKRGTVAIVHDDTADGRDAASLLAQDLPTVSVSVGPNVEIAAAAPAVDAPLTAISQARVSAVIVWGGDAFVARVLTAARSAGSALPFYTGPSGESPVVRQLAGGAAEGLYLVAARMTSESDAEGFGKFEHRLAAAEGGPIDAGVKNAAGEEIRQPADTDFYAYDAVRLVAEALKKSATPRAGKPLLDAFTSVSVTSANGDHRGFRPDTHEGIADGDLYIAQIHDNQFQPVKDEPLSATLPEADEILADFH